MIPLRATPTPATSYSALISLPRLTTLLVSFFVALSAGTNYVYSAYAPQLGSRLNITHTQLNIVGIAGGVGAFLAAPFWGRLVDARGPRPLLTSAFFLQLLGYYGIQCIFDVGLSPNAETLSSWMLGVLVLCRFMTGAGGNAGLTASVNTTSKTFPDNARGASTGLVMSGFGLSAFLFSTVSRLKYPGNTSSFLRLLTLGTALPSIVGFVFIKVIPLPSTPEQGLAEESGRALEESPLLNDTSVSSTPIQPEDIYGRRLWSSSEFWLLFTILSILAGTGFTYINNAGSIAQALYRSSLSTIPYDPATAARFQADQVSAISVLNFSGRILIGILTDALKTHLALPRSYSLVLVSSIFFLSQLLALFVGDVRALWTVSATLGLAHGSVYSLMPMVVLDWWGMRHFSENWGYIIFSPFIGANVFAYAFGRTLDSHTEIGDGGKGVCAQGRRCYENAVYITMGTCALGVGLSLLARRRDWIRSR